MVTSYRIRITGVVQGVGMRPYIYNLAKRHGLMGWCLNDSQGVSIEIHGPGAARFIETLKTAPPPLAKIETFDLQPVSSIFYRGFTIRESVVLDNANAFTLISPDIATCADCLHELFDPADRRTLYPFINCTNCGPRYSIIKQTPYDRGKTTMAAFALCPECAAEYRNPADRRFHAQPNACALCGPRVWLVNKAGTAIEDAGINHNAIKKAQALLKDGAILAIKGLGGFHLACDAENEQAVARLRGLKRTSISNHIKGGGNKPFAVMVADVEAARRFAKVTEQERLALEDRRRPIVLLEKLQIPQSTLLQRELCLTRDKFNFLDFKDWIPDKSHGNDGQNMSIPSFPRVFSGNPVVKIVMQRSTFAKGGDSPSHFEKWGGDSPPHFEKGGGRGGICLASAVSPNNSRYGVMLPYTPLHHLLFHGADLAALVMTSGNRSDEPICISNDAAVAKLSSIADAFILHDRDIHNRVDDSIVRVDNDTMRVVRRSRGFVPNTIDLGAQAIEVYATGPLLKNTFCITKGRSAILSQHIGDLENLETMQFYEDSRASINAAFNAAPALIAHDMHPDYMSTRLALEYAAANKLKTHAVQHHHAHIVSCMAEHGIDRSVIGAVFDGTGFGTDGNVWGGEFMQVTRRNFKRVGHLEYVPMPGGDKAVLEPWRMAVAYLHKAYGSDWAQTPGMARFAKTGAATLIKMIETRTNSPLTSSAGRLFDAVAALIGLCDVISYEAEAAIMLEAVARPSGGGPYPFNIRGDDLMIIDTNPLIKAIVEDIAAGVDGPVISWRFHLTLAVVITAAAQRMAAASGLFDMVLSGGVFQNALLLSLTVERLSEKGFKAWTHERVPTNDGGVSLGQAVVALEQSKPQLSGH